MTPASFTAAAHLSAAKAWRESDSEPHRNFADQLETWAANALSRAPAVQGELFNGDGR